MPCEKCKQSYLDSYEVTVETIRQNQPTLSDHDVRVAAAATFRPRFFALQQSSGVENSGKDIYENGEFTMVDGKMYFPETDQFAETLHKNQLASSRLHNDPTRYSKADHDRTLLVQQSLANGATVAKTAFDGVNGAHRDMVEYQYDPATNRGKIIVHDLSKQYGSLDMTSMKQAVFRQSGDLRAVVQSENVFVLTDAPSSTPRPIERVVRAQEHVGIFDKGQARFPNIEEAKQEAPLNQTIRHIGETVHFVRKRVFAETRETVQSVRRWTSIQRAERVLQKKELPAVFRADSSIRQKLLFIEKIGVGVGAAPRILASLAENLPEPVRAVEKNIARHKKKELKKQQKREKPAFAASSPKRLWRVGDEASAGKREAKKIQRVFLRPRVEEIFKRKKEIQKKKRAKVYREHPTGYRIYTIGEQNGRAEKRRRMRYETKRVKKNIRAEKMTRLALEKPKRRRSRLIFELKRSHERKPRRRKERSITPWILLSIIWYLTARREHGRQTKPPKKKVTLPRRAVIFAYQ